MLVVVVVWLYCVGGCVGARAVVGTEHITHLRHPPITFITSPGKNFYSGRRAEKLAREPFAKSWVVLLTPLTSLTPGQIGAACQVLLMVLLLVGWLGLCADCVAGASVTVCWFCLVDVDVFLLEHGCF